MRRDTPDWVAGILHNDAFWLLTRLMACFMFWITGIEWLMTPAKAAGAAGMVGLWPPAVFGWVLIAFYLLGSLAILFDRYVWLVAGAFGVFTLLAILLVHHLWTFPAEQRAQQWLVAKEHLTVIGGLMALAVASHMRRHVRGLARR